MPEPTDPFRKITTPQISLSKIEEEKEDFSVVKKIISENINNQNFRKNISPLDSNKLSEQTFTKALDVLLGAQIELPQSERVKLFNETLEYYSKFSPEKNLVFHSTGSYALRKSLEDGFSGGHGRFSGEALVMGHENPQEGLSVSHIQGYHAVEPFQQLYARINAKKDELPNYLKIDSEKITNKTVTETFIREFLNTIPKEKLRQAMAKRMNVDTVDDKTIEQYTSETEQQILIEKFSNEQYIPNVDKIKNEIFPKIQDEQLKTTLLEEAEHPFPVLLTFDTSGREESLASFDEENPSHIPFEDHFYGKFTGKDIREIRVPQNQIPKVSKWLDEKKLNYIKIIPMELYEIKRVIEESI